MLISRQALDIISASVDDTPPEIGGIMGSLDGHTVTEIIMDEPEGPRYNCYYAPNVRFLNNCISSWQQSDVEFMGVFHTHYAGVKTLSSADVKYITSIMNAMPEEIKSLYFPVFVLPQREMICYKAIKELSSVSIESETIEIVE